MNISIGRRSRNIKVIITCMISIFALILLSSYPTKSNLKNKRVISIYNIHTKETLTIAYKKKGKYIQSALKKINYIMGDWRRKETTKIDPKLIDLMWELHNELGSKKPIYLISGYRSQKTNNLLRKTRGGQARRSRHILGKAADVHFPDIPIRQLRNSALVRQRGGVGYYPTSALPFVHLDTGRVRHWPRMKRYELAALFPNGRSKHIPRDGKPITKKDYRVAIARLTKKQRRRFLLAQSKKKKRQSGTQIASLVAPLGLTKKGRKVTEKPGWYKDKDKKPNQKFDKKKLLRLASIQPEKTPGLPANTLTDESVPKLSGRWVSAPAYDEEHPDELSYTPFPVLPLMKDKSISYDNELVSLSAPEHDKFLYLYGEPTQMIPLRFRQGLQFAEMLWATDFKGKAVINIISGQPKYPNHHLEALQKRKKQKFIARN